MGTGNDHCNTVFFEMTAEQPFLGCKIGVHALMIIQVITTEIGKKGHIKRKAQCGFVPGRGRKPP